MTHCGASIVPFSVDPIHRNVYFLLAQERNGRWRGANTWSDFGGKRCGSEAPSRTASREFFEESCATVRVEDGLPRTASDIERCLADQRYAFRIDFEGGGGHDYVTFVKQVPWQPSMSKTFNQTIKALVRARHGAPLPPSLRMHPAVTPGTDSASIHDGFLEKQQLRYYSVPQLYHALAHPSQRLCSSRLRVPFSHRLTIILKHFTASPPRSPLLDGFCDPPQKEKDAGPD